MKITKVYTRTGDKGETSIVGGIRMKKSSERLEAYGTVDELSSHLGLLAAMLSEGEHREMIIRIQKNLFNVCSNLATDQSQTPLYDSARLAEGEIELLEKEVDRMMALLPERQGFILPGGTQAAAQAHVCRTVCRRAERQGWRLAALHPVDALDLKYLNRLSDYFFVLARFFGFLDNVGENNWESNK